MQESTRAREQERDREKMILKEKETITKATKISRITSEKKKIKYTVHLSNT